MKYKTIENSKLPKQNNVKEKQICTTHRLQLSPRSAAHCRREKLVRISPLPHWLCSVTALTYGPSTWYQVAVRKVKKDKTLENIC